jgi:two-component system, NtrC family, sensor kinase
MKLAAKLLLSLAGLALVAIAVTGWVEHQRRAELLALDIDQDQRVGRVLQESISALCADAGVDVCRRLVESINQATPRRSILWIWLRDIPDAQLRHDIEAVDMNDPDPGRRVVWRILKDEQGVDVRYLYVPLRLSGAPAAAIEVSESLAPHDAFIRRSDVHAAALGVVVLFLGSALAVILGVLLVGRPVRLLSESVRALGEGRHMPPIVLRSGDELADLANELNTVGARLAARERLQHADRLRTIGQLASGVAHELGTPLSVIGVRARLIVTGEATGNEVAENARVILDTSSRMTALVRQLLDYSRRQGAQMELVDLRQVVNGSLAMVEPLADKHGVQVETQLPERPVLVCADQTQLQQVVTNVAVNGIQAMPRGGRLRIEVGQGRPGGSLGRADSHGDFAWIRVTDDGPGVAPEHLDHVFDPFFTTKPVGEGTGLGLAVVHAIVQEHGGSVTVSNEPGHGASFTVFLPPVREQPALERLAS